MASSGKAGNDNAAVTVVAEYSCLRDWEGPVAEGAYAHKAPAADEQVSQHAQNGPVVERMSNSNHIAKVPRTTDRSARALRSDPMGQGL